MAALAIAVEPSTELALPELSGEGVIARIFQPGGTDDLIEKIRAKAFAQERDISTERGRAAIKSMAYTIARSKTALDDAGKNLTADLKKQTAAVDAERKRMRDAFDRMKDEFRSPLTEYEFKDQARVAVHENTLTAIQAVAASAGSLRLDEFDGQIDHIKSFQSRDWQEFEKRGQEAINGTLHVLYNAKDDAERLERERVEAERVRSEAAAKAQEEREERIRQEAAAKAKADAEAAAERNAREEAARVEREKRQAEELAASERRAIEAKAYAERLAAERAQLDAEARVRAAQEATREADRQAFWAAEQERQRIDKQRRDEAEAAERREANKRHVAKVNNGIVAAFTKLGITDALAKAAVVEMAKGLIPNVKVHY